MPLGEPDGTNREMITSFAAPVVMEAPEGVVVAGWLFKTEVWSRGDTVSAPENSQIIAAPVPLVDGVMLWK